MAVGYERGGVGGGGGRGGGEEGRKGEEVAAAGWAGGDEGEDFGDEALLDCCVLWHWELASARFCEVVDVGGPAGCRIWSI